MRADIGIEVSIPSIRRMLFCVDFLSGILWIMTRSRIHEGTILLRFLGIMRILILVVSVYDVYIKNRFQTTFAQWEGGGWRQPPSVEVLWTARKKILNTFVPMTFKNLASGLLTLIQNVPERKVSDVRSLLIMRPLDDAFLGQRVPDTTRAWPMCPDPLGQTNLMLGYRLGTKVKYGIRSPKFNWSHKCTAVLIGWAETQQPPPAPIPSHLGSYTRALLISQDRRHLFVTPFSGHIFRDTLWRQREPVPVLPRVQLVGELNHVVEAMEVEVLN